MNGGQLKIKAERRGDICVVSLVGPLNMAAFAELTECIRTERTARPARLVIDMSGVNLVDFGGARALATAVGPVPGQCPVLVRSIRPAARRFLEQTGLDPVWLGPHRGSAERGTPPRGWDMALADSRTGVLVREWQHLHGSAQQTIAASWQAAQSLASTEEHVAATLHRLAARRPTVSAHLESLSRTARSYAVTLRNKHGHEANPVAPASRRRPSIPSGTVERAVTFIEERARDDISVTEIAAAAFVTTRAMQLAFRRYLGTTPLIYLRQIRLERAHAQLLSADPCVSTVTAVAADWRFTSPSRFATYYRAVYGVPPSQTLAQRPPAD